MAYLPLLGLLCCLNAVTALHDGRFVHADPWSRVSIIEEIRQGVIWDILPSVTFYVVLSVAVCLLNEFQTRIYVGLPSTMLTVLGTVIGFTVSYRTSSAYARFLEGAHLWGETISSCRTLSRLLWFHIPNYLKPPLDGEAVPECDKVKVLLEKKTILNLVEAYAVTLKHYLRGESGILWEDCYHLTCMLPKYSMPTSIPIARGDLTAEHRAHHGRHVVEHHRSDTPHPVVTLVPPTPAVHRSHTQPPPPWHPAEAHHHHHRHRGRGGTSDITPGDEKELANVIPADRSTVNAMDLEHGAAGYSPFCPIVPDDVAAHTNNQLLRTNTAPAKLQREEQRKNTIHGSHSSRSYGDNVCLTQHFQHHSEKDPEIRLGGHVGDSRMIYGGSAATTSMDFASSHTLKRSLRRSSSSAISIPHSNFHGPRNPPFPLMPARNPPRFSFVNDLCPFLAPIKKVYLWLRSRTEARETTIRRHHKANLRRKRHASSDNLPLTLILHLSSYVAALQRRRTLDVPTTTALLNVLTGMQQQLTSLEKILSTPIPLAYQLHLKHATMCYLLFLPFQLQPILGWNAVPALFVASFMFLGFLEIGQAIESPFGYDRNDLDLDEICQTVIAPEIREISAHPPSDPDDFIFLHINEPLAPADRRSALQLVTEGVSLAECERALLKGHEKDRGWRNLHPTLKQDSQNSHYDA